MPVLAKKISFLEMSVYLPNCQTGLGIYLTRSLQSGETNDTVPFYQVKIDHHNRFVNVKERINCDD